MKLIVISIISLIGLITPAFASEDNIGFSKITPASPFYFLKTIRENFELKFALTKRVRMLRQLEFAFRRLREARTLINHDEDLIPPTLERYKSHLDALPDKDLPDEQVVLAIKDNLSSGIKVLGKMHQQASLPRTKMFIRSTIYRIIQRADAKASDKGSVCDFFAREASSSALNDTERFVLIERAKVCIK